MSKLANVAGSFETITNGLSKFLIGVCAILLFVMMALISYEVLLRYIFKTSLIWSFEVTEYMLVALAVLGVAYIQAQGKHIKVEFLVDRLQPRAQAAVGLFTSIIALFLFIMFTLAGWHAAWEAWSLNVKSWSVFKIPQFPVRVLIPISGFVMCLYLLAELGRNMAALRGKGKAGSH